MFLSVTTGSISTALFATVIGVPVWRASSNLVFLIFTGIVKNNLVTSRKKNNKHSKTAMLARNKLNNIKSKISESLINNEISHEDLMTMINEEKKISQIKRKYYNNE